MFNTFKSLFLEALLIIFMLLDSFFMQDELARQRGWWMEKDLKSALLEIRKVTMAP